MSSTFSSHHTTLQLTALLYRLDHLDFTFQLYEEHDLEIKLNSIIVQPDKEPCVDISVLIVTCHSSANDRSITQN